MSKFHNMDDRFSAMLQKEADDRMKEERNFVESLSPASLDGSAAEDRDTAAAPEDGTARKKKGRPRKSETAGNGESGRTKSKVYGMSLDPKLHERVKLVAYLKGTTVSAIVAELLKQYLKDNEKAVLDIIRDEHN